MKGRKYLFIAAMEGFPWGGSELLWSETAEKLATRGNEVRVSVKDWGGPLPQVERLRRAGCQISYRRSEGFLARQVRKILPRPGLAPLHIRSIGEEVDLVVISQGANTDGLHWMEAAHSAGLKYAVVSHGAAEQFWPDDDKADRLVRAYDNALAAYFVSQGNIDLSARQFGGKVRNAKIVRSPFNVRYDADPAWPVNPSAEMRLACVGRLDAAQKGQDLVLEVLSLAHWRERGVRLSLIGVGANERCLQRNARNLGLNNIEFLGYQTDIEGVWAQHHVLVLASRYEGLPLAVIEAMMCGRPCIVTDVAGNRELIRDGINGFIAGAATVRLLDEAMNRSWENRGRLREMGEQARKDVREFVPADPAEDFAVEIERVANG